MDFIVNHNCIANYWKHLGKHRVLQIIISPLYYMQHCSILTWHLAFRLHATLVNTHSTRVLQAALWDNAELLEDLLNGEQLAHLDCRDAWGRTPLHAAATTENSRCLRILLQAGADANMASGPRAEARVRRIERGWRIK